MSTIFNFKDSYSITKPTEEDINVWKDSLGPSYNGPKKALRILVEATHAALINRNARWYSPSKMRDGADTFVNKNKPAKILKHHDTHSDPVGVVRGSRFVSTIPADLVDNPDVMILMSSTASMKDQIKSMKRLIKSGVTKREDWKGLGYIEVMADILDPEAIEQISDGRFDAVSTSFSSPGHAYCFICGKNWAQDGTCEHSIFGEIYEDEDEEKWPMMLIPGLHVYDEMSLVVHDADPYTVIKASDSKEDKVLYEYKPEQSDACLNSGIRYEFKDFVNNEEDDTMKTNSEASPSLSDKEKVLFDKIKSFRTEIEDEKANAFAIKLATLQQEDGKYPLQEEAELDDETAFIYAFEAIETAEDKLDADAIYDGMSAELDAMKEEGIITEQELSDKKLSSETRSKMSESTFCGPERSFPVPDCAHVTAARRLIGKYKGPGDKTAILACVARKAKALGCGESSKSKEVEDTSNEIISFVMPSCECMKKATDEEAQALFAKAEAELIVRNLKVARECSKCADSQEELNKALSEIKELKGKLSDSHNSLAVLREELKFQQSDYVHQVDKFIELSLQFKELNQEKLAIMGTLVGKYKSIDIAKESLKTEDIAQAEASIIDKFDIVKMTEKLNDGMSKAPKAEKIESPVNSVYSDNTLEILTGPAAGAVSNIRDMLKNKEARKAKQVYNKMVSMGVIPKEITFETISATNTNSAE